MPAEKPFNRYYPSKPGRLLPLELRQRQLEYRRRTAGLEFRQGKADVRSFPLVLSYLKKVVDDFDERFEKYTDVFEAWHKVRVAILDSDRTGPDFFEQSNALRQNFERTYFTDPETGRFSENKFEKVKPVITEITNLVSRGR